MNAGEAGGRSIPDGSSDRCEKIQTEKNRDRAKENRADFANIMRVSTSTSQICSVDPYSGRVHELLTAK